MDERSRASGMAQQRKALACKPDNLSSDPRTHMMRKALIPTRCALTSSYTPMYAHTQ